MEILPKVLEFVDIYQIRVGSLLHVPKSPFYEFLPQISKFDY